MEGRSVEEPGDSPEEEASMLSEVALGRMPADTVIVHGVLFNAFTREFLPAHSVWVKDGRIAYAGPDPDPPMDERTLVIDAEGMVLLPGLVEGHTHVVNRCGVEEFVRHVIPGGVTTVVTETIELASVVGLEGISHLVAALEDQPVRFFYTVPPLCGLTEEEETKAPPNERLLPLLGAPQCLGVGEIYWANLFLPGRQGVRVRELAAMALEMGKRVEGHTAGASGRKLQAYAGFGISSCHEPIAEEEVVERLRLGFSVMLRQGAVRKELDGVRGIFRRDMDLRRLVLSTDSMDPEGFLAEGYLDAAVRSAIALGAPPGLAYQMVTVNVAEHFRLDHMIGSLSPGRMADVVIIPSPEDFTPRLVMREGKTLFRNGRLVVEPRSVVYPEWMFHTVNPPGGPLPVPPERGKVRAMELVTRLVTQERIVDLGDPEGSKDVLMVLAADRTGGEGSFLGLLKGFGLRRGACGSTMCWDTGDMIVIGCDIASMETVIGRLREIGGGATYAVGREIVAEFPAPLCGMVSLKPMDELRDGIRGIEEALRCNGVPWEKCLLTIDTLSTAAIPHVRITHHGYVRLRDRAVLTLTP
jgi:adenine deaminase